MFHFLSPTKVHLNPCIFWSDIRLVHMRHHRFCSILAVLHLKDACSIFVHDIATQGNIASDLLTTDFKRSIYRDFTHRKPCIIFLRCRTHAHCLGCNIEIFKFKSAFATSVRWRRDSNPIALLILIFHNGIAECVVISRLRSCRKSERMNLERFVET